MDPNPHTLYSPALNHPPAPEAPIPMPPAERITRVARLRTIDQFRAHEQRDDQQPRYGIVQFGMK